MKKRNMVNQKYMYVNIVYNKGSFGNFGSWRSINQWNDFAIWKDQRSYNSIPKYIPKYWERSITS